MNRIVYKIFVRLLLILFVTNVHQHRALSTGPGLAIEYADMQLTPETHYLPQQITETYNRSSQNSVRTIDYTTRAIASNKKVDSDKFGFFGLTEDETAFVGALIKVNHRLDDNAFNQMNANVHSVSGNVLAISIIKENFNQLLNVKGICAAQLDHLNSCHSTVDMSIGATKYGNANIVVGILDNSGFLDLDDMALLQKVEPKSNIGFISYASNRENATVIMRNLKGGESNLVIALSYMEEYAQTVERPLVIEMMLTGEEMLNPLFVQVCQRMADSGVQFLGGGINLGTKKCNKSVQLAFTMYNPKTGQITDQSSYWGITEIIGQEIMLMGSNKKNCSILFTKESETPKISLSNSSEDVVMITAITSDGLVHYYHIKSKTTVLLPRCLFNGMPIFRDNGVDIYPYLSRRGLCNGAKNINRMVAIKTDIQNLNLVSSDMDLSVSAQEAGFLGIKIDKVDTDLVIRVLDINGEVIYRNSPTQNVKSIHAKVDLTDSADGLYFLSLTSPSFNQTFSLVIE
ncbi:MAG: hypothetical protein JKX84_01130 [Flavobacteriales bacterium]|nr:hypothetical protein [Flavobacteriales bacterium]